MARSQRQPGTPHYLAMDVLLACSLNTVLVNGNPLLRYDGYRILAKPAEIPSLRCSSSLSG